MIRTDAHRSIAALALIGYVLAGLSGMPLVVCEGEDGHRGIEFVHGTEGCGNGGHAQAGLAEAMVTARCHVSSCDDTLLRTMIPVEWSPKRTSAMDVLAASASAIRSPQQPRQVWQTDRSPPADVKPPHFQQTALQSVILII